MKLTIHDVFLELDDPEQLVLKLVRIAHHWQLNGSREERTRALLVVILAIQSITIYIGSTIYVVFSQAH